MGGGAAPFFVVPLGVLLSNVLLGAGGAAPLFFFAVPWALPPLFLNKRGSEGQDVRSGDFCEMHFLFCGQLYKWHETFVTPMSKIVTFISCSHMKSSILGNAWGPCL